MLPHDAPAPRPDPRFTPASTLDLGRIAARKAASPAKKVDEVILKHPHKAVSVIRNWLHQDE